MNMKLPHLKHAPHHKAPLWKEKLHDIGRDPFTDWVLISAASLIVAVLLVWAGTSSYLSVDEQSAGASPVPSHPTTVDAKTLNAVLGQFDARAAEQASLLHGYGGPGDPSL